jgi:prepilin-type processing-associated H-X9-DG protein
MLSPNRRPRQRGFTLLEGTVVLVIVVIAAILLIPVIRIALDSSRKSRCSLNLSRQGKLLEEYVTQYNQYPAGCKVQPDGGSGPSWWFALLPYTEFKDSIYGRWKKGPVHGDFNAAIANDNLPLVDGVVPPFMICPSSPLPRLNNPLEHIAQSNRQTLGSAEAQGIVLPMYAAVSGSAPDMLAVRLGTQPVAPAGRNTNDGKFGILSASGAFPPNISASGAHLKGPTMLIVEQSDWGRIPAEKSSILFDMRSSYPAGAYMGTAGNYGQLSVNASGINGTGEQRCFNCTTIRHPINTRQFEAGVVSHVTPPTLTDESGEPIQITLPPGAAIEGPGHNHGIFSAHPGGAHVLFADLSVRFMNEQADVVVLFMLATRDDEGIVSSKDY